MRTHLTNSLDVLTPAPPREGRELPALDTLRAIGALCVLTTHAAFWSGDYLRNGVWGNVLARLDVGVAIFFVLSGFLLSRPWLLSRVRGRPAPSASTYLWKRAWRILPLYVVTVVLALSLIEQAPGFSFGGWVSTLLMLDTLTGTSFPAGLTHMWTIAVEVSFYLVLPLLMPLLLGRGTALRPARLVAGLGALSAISVWWHLQGGRLAGDLGAGAPLQLLPGFLTWFALGIGLALAHVVLHENTAGTGESTPASGGRTLTALGSLARQPGSCWVLAVGLMLAAATPVAGASMFGAPTPGQSLSKHLIYASVAVLLVLPAVLGDPEGRYVQALSWRPLRRLGWISFGIFCLHLPLLHLLMWTTGWTLFEGRGPQIWAITIVLSVLVAELAYRLVERPALRVGHATRPGRRAPASSSATTGTTQT